MDKGASEAEIKKARWIRGYAPISAQIPTRALDTHPPYPHPPAPTPHSHPHIIYHLSNRIFRVPRRTAKRR